jgi:hypothetical protein
VFIGDEEFTELFDEFGSWEEHKIHDNSIKKDYLAIVYQIIQK